MGYFKSHISHTAFLKWMCVVYRKKNFYHWYKKEMIFICINRLWIMLPWIYNVSLLISSDFKWQMTLLEYFFFFKKNYIFELCWKNVLCWYNFGNDLFDFLFDLMMVTWFEFKSILDFMEDDFNTDNTYQCTIFR